MLDKFQLAIMQLLPFKDSSETETRRRYSDNNNEKGHERHENKSFHEPQIILDYLFLIF